MPEGSRTPRRNKHGVPVYPMKPRCLFGCGFAQISEAVPLCTVHATRVFGELYQDPMVARIHEQYNEFREQRWRDEEAQFAARSEAAKKRQTADGVVYYVKNAGHIKIGWTSDLAKRMKAYPPGCELLAVHPGTQADERKLHKRFAVHLAFGREWYPLVPVVLDHIKRMVAEHGTPEAVDFGAKPTEVPRPHAGKEFSKRKGWRRVA